MGETAFELVGLGQNRHRRGPAGNVGVELLAGVEGLARKPAGRR